MKTIHLISHTHWDREWYRTFQQFRLRLVHLMDGLLDILATDPDFKHFMLDGQTIILDDYLLMRPEKESALRRLVQSRRLLIGPWHVLPDMFLVSPEAHIRNLLAGEREARRFGVKMNIGYMPDSFGHIGQMPQILRGFGIDNACLWRGLDDQPTELWWQSPDGSQVLLLYMRDSYSNGAGFVARNPGQFSEQIERAADSLAAHSKASNLLVMYGTDHMEPVCETSQAIKAANRRLKNYCVIHSTLPDYLAAVQSEIKAGKFDLPTVLGELRSCKRSHLLPGVLSTRMWIKQRNQACENLLEKWAEPFSTFAEQLLADNQLLLSNRKLEIVRQAWLLLMQNHPHDSICGCSIDQVHEEMRTRFDQVEQIGEEITCQSLEALALQVDNENRTVEIANPLSAVIVFNPLSFPRTDTVSVELTLTPELSEFEIVDTAGNIIPHQSTSGKVSDLLTVLVRREELGGLLGMVHEGRAGNLAIQDIHFNRDGATLKVEAVFAENAEPNLRTWNNSLKTFQEYLDDTSIESFHIHARSPDSASVTFAAANVPPLGWKTFFIRAKAGLPVAIHVTPWMRLLTPLAKLPAAQNLLNRLAQPKVKPPYIIENDLLSVEMNTQDGSLTVTDKVTGQVFHGMNRFVDSGDCGDEYNFCPPPMDSCQNKPNLQGVSITRGPVKQTMAVSLVLNIPVSLSSDRKSRSARTVELPIQTTIALTKGVPRVDVHTRVDNRARDHRLRVHFAAPFAVDSASYDGHFEIVKRPLGIPRYDATWVEEPRPETHQRAFTSINDGKNILTIANRGLPEVEVLRKDENLKSEVAITLLRCVGWLSREDFSNRRSHAGPFLETPRAQMLGEDEFDYSIVIGRSDHSSYQQAWSFETPLRATPTGIHSGALPLDGSFAHVDNPCFVVTAVKKTENGEGWILRGYNMADEAIRVTLAPWRRFKKARIVNLAEKTVSTLQVTSSGDVTFEARKHEVVTVLFYD